MKRWPLEMSPAIVPSSSRTREWAQNDLMEMVDTNYGGGHLNSMVVIGENCFKIESKAKKAKNKCKTLKHPNLPIVLEKLRILHSGEQ